VCDQQSTIVGRSSAVSSGGRCYLSIQIQTVDRTCHVHRRRQVLPITDRRLSLVYIVLGDGGRAVTSRGKCPYCGEGNFPETCGVVGRKQPSRSLQLFRCNTGA